jgi:hypothetical protein
VSREPAEEACELRAPSAVRRALSESLPEAVAAAADEFITGPLLLDPHRIGKRLLPPMEDRFSARRGTYRGHLPNRRQGSPGDGGRHRPPPRRLPDVTSRVLHALPNNHQVLPYQAAPLHGAGSGVSGGLCR